MISSKCLRSIVCGASLLVLTLCFSTNVSAQKNKNNQNVLKRGDMVMGTVVDVAENPMTDLKVLESSVEDRVMTFTSTDSNGDFALKIHDPKDSLQIKIKGYQTVSLALDKKYYSITLVPLPAASDNKDVAEVK